LRGYGLSGDAHDVVAPREDAMSVQYAMQLALSRAGIEFNHHNCDSRLTGLQLTDVDYINAHATSTPAGDVIESQ
jgi:3-oxoacyl-[acyl-carrier-protein] synthase II